MKKRLALLLLLAAASAFGAEGNWKQVLAERLPLYGHRNWIVVADSAYPAQSREGIETIVSGAGQLDVLKQVLGAISASRHVRPVVYTDQELKYVEDKEAPGIAAYRQQLAAVLGNRKVNELLHEQIIAKLDQVSQTFRVLIIKTNMTIPYTSVFLELNAGYWGADAETRLRARMAAQSH
jgi:hypothetical protein